MIVDMKFIWQVVIIALEHMVKSYTKKKLHLEYINHLKKLRDLSLGMAKEYCKSSNEKNPFENNSYGT